MAEIECPHCRRPMDATGSICRKCSRTLDRALTKIAGHYTDLNTLRTSMTRYGAGSTGGRPGTAEGYIGIDLAFAPGGAATKAATLTRTVIATWCSYAHEHHTQIIGPVCQVACLHLSCARIRITRPPRNSIPSGCEYLRRYVEWWRTSTFGPEILEDMLTVETTLERIVDRPADRWYAGVCTAQLDDHTLCTCELYATHGHGEITCRQCGTLHNIDDRRAWLLAAAEDYECTTSQLARAVTMFDDRYDGTETTLNARIRKWAQRSQLTPIRHEIRYSSSGLQVKRPLYRLGDVLDLLTADHKRKTTA